ncbi:hypothetical protein [Patiriisocius sp. Uisw_047]|jgi:hypothetical protein|uniref:hypothetical protein n=1 Tax=Patiriisocius sp. Uisw_047 TaxID=3230969 RepID=UPI0039E760F3
MKKFLKVFLIAMLFLNANVFAQELPFDITNATGVDLLYIQVSESNDSNWGPDIIPDDIFYDGDTFKVSLPIYENTICAHDMKVTDFEEEYVILTGADLCELYEITLLFDDNGQLTWYLE